MSSADRRGSIGTSAYWLHTWPRRYGFAAAVVASATALRFSVGAVIPFHAPYTFFYPTVVLVAMLAGVGPGILATLLATVLGSYFFVEPRNTFQIRTAEDVVVPLLFSIIGLFLTFLAGSRKQAEQALEESEDRYRDLVEHSQDLVCTHDLEGRLLSVNPAPARVLGYEVAELLRMPMRDLVAPEFRQQFDAYLGRIKTTGEDRGVLCVLTRAGERRIWEYHNTLRREGVTSPIVRGMARDITECKRAEAALRQREQDYRSFVAQSSEGIFRQDLDAPIPIDLPEDKLVHHILYDSYLAECNDAMARMYGLTVRDSIGKRLTETLDPNDPRNIELTREYIRSGFRVVERESHEVDIHGNPKVFLNSMIGIVEKGMLLRTWGIQRDVTERAKIEECRRKAEEALQASEAHFRLLVEQASDGIFIADAQGKCLDVNSAGAEMLGYTREELLQLSIPDIVAAEDAPRIATEVARVEGGATARSEWTLRRKDGSVFPGEVCGKQLPDGRLQGILRDITERRQAEEALRESEERLRLAQQAANLGVFDANRRTGLVRWSPEMHDLYGIPRGSFDGTFEGFLRQVHPEDQPRVRALIELGDRTGEAKGEWRVALPDGTVRWLASHWKVYRNERGEPERAIGVDVDITERRQAEEAMRRDEERFRVALKDSPITVFNQDRDLRYTWIYNPQLCWQVEAVGKSDEEMLGPKKAAGLVELKRQVLKTGAASRGEVAISYNGRSYAFDIAIEPLFDADGNVIGITGASVDIARLREMTDRLQEARDKLAQEKSYLEKEIQTELGFEEIIGQSPALHEVLKKARVVAPTDSTVLLLGETGTGKELVARSVHSLSSRRERNFIKLNCAAVPSGLLESELFGHEKGAFTGAVSQKIGQLELADKGTLFLDEIGELPLELQPKLLRVLQDREFERLGGVQTLHVDVRIISATNRELQKDVAEKKFREDLFYRLNVFPIQLPPLRDRRSDIPKLVHYFVRKHAGRMGKHIETIPDETMGVLQRWNWPGNVRELENMIERMVILSQGQALAPPPAELTGPQEFLDDNLREMDREHIIRILRETNGILSGADGAASRLGIKRTTLQSMLKRFGIEAHEYRRATETLGRE